MRISTIFFLVLVNTSPFFSLKASETLELYTQIEDLYHPTQNDYRLIQSFISNNISEELELLTEYDFHLDRYYQISKNFKIIGNSEDQLPKSGIEFINSEKNQRDKCIISYASFNKNYTKGLSLLIENIKKTDYKGHYLYKFGGWPNTEGGSLTLAHVPYAFKVCLFKEAKRLGYRKVLWVDTSFVPNTSIEELFEVIERDGYYLIGMKWMVGPFFNSTAAEYYGISLSDAYHIPSCSTIMMGVDFSNPKASELIDLWYEAAQDKYAYYSSRMEQNSLSILMHQMGLKFNSQLEEIEHLFYKPFVHQEKNSND